MTVTINFSRLQWLNARVMSASVCAFYRFHSETILLPALTGVAQRVGCRPANRQVAGLIPGQGTCVGGGPGPLLGMCERRLMHVSLVHPCFSPSLSPSLPLSLKINK